MIQLKFVQKKKRFFHNLYRDDVFDSISFVDVISHLQDHEISSFLKYIYENLDKITFTKQSEENKNIHVICEIFDSLSPIIKSNLFKHFQNLLLDNSTTNVVIENIIETTFYLNWAKDIVLLENILINRKNSITIRRLAAKSLATGGNNLSKTWTDKLEGETDPTILCYGFIAINNVNKIDAFNYIKDNPTIFSKLDLIKVTIYSSLVEIESNPEIIEIILSFPEEIQQYFRDLIFSDVVFNDDELSLLRHRITDKLKQRFIEPKGGVHIKPFKSANEIEDIRLFSSLPKYQIKTVKQGIPDLKLIQFAEEKGFFSKFNIEISYLNDEERFSNKSTSELVQNLYDTENTRFGIVSLPPITAQEIMTKIRSLSASKTNVYDIFVQNIYLGFNIWGRRDSKRYDHNNPEESFKKIVESITAPAPHLKVWGLDSGSKIFVKILEIIYTKLYGIGLESKENVYVDDKNENYNSNLLIENLKNKECDYIIGSAITNHYAEKEGFVEVFSAADLVDFLNFTRNTDRGRIENEINDFYRLTQLFNSWNFITNDGSRLEDNLELIKRLYGIAKYSVNYILERRDEFFEFLINSWNSSFDGPSLEKVELIALFGKYYLFKDNIKYNEFFNNETFTLHYNQIRDYNYEMNYSLQEKYISKEGKQSKDGTHAKKIFLHIKDDERMYLKDLEQFEQKSLNSEHNEETDQILNTLYFFKEYEFFGLGSEEIAKKQAV